MPVFTKNINTTMTTILTEASKADIAEAAAYHNLMSRGFESWAAPAGSDAGFPDFGLTMDLGNDETLDLHVEFKAAKNAQMGSMRDWVWNSETQRFTAKTTDDNKELLLRLMNLDAECKENAARLMADFQEYVSEDLTTIESGMLTVIDDKEERKELLRNFSENTEHLQLSKIEDPSLGAAFLRHYKNKFRPRDSATYSLLVLMMDRELYFIKNDGVPKEVIQQLEDRLGLTDPIPLLTKCSARLEVRIQPRGLNSSSPARIDTMASYRLRNVEAGSVLV